MEIKLEKENMVYTVQKDSDFHKELIARDFKEVVGKKAATTKKAKNEEAK
ncbi:hypothetical protein [Enterococcus diestrammenae]|nr:hypothetical protein [Enterococcus diestrammenae]